MDFRQRTEYAPGCRGSDSGAALSDCSRLPGNESLMLSFIIPALNERDNIGRCVSSVARHVPEDLAHEIVVVDNGSEDETVRLARQAGAKVVASTAGTIGAVRNRGTAASSGDVLVFLDADCALTPEWGREIGTVLETMKTVSLCCAGSQVTPPQGESVFLWKYWFLPFVAQETASHLGSAHMLCSRETFMRIGGFNEDLETGEDYEFCARLKKAGGSVLNVPALSVEHYGFPRTWAEFIRRERWYGREDMMSFAAFRSSKVAVMSALFVIFAIGGVVAVLIGFTSVGLVGLGVAAILVGATSVVKFGHAGVKVQTMSMSIIPVYFLARAVAALDELSRRINVRDGPRLRRRE